jgi:hypothetical protein
MHGFYIYLLSYNYNKFNLNHKRKKKIKKNDTIKISLTNYKEMKKKLPLRYIMFLACCKSIEKYLEKKINGSRKKYIKHERKRRIKLLDDQIGLLGLLDVDAVSAADVAVVGGVRGERFTAIFTLLN